MADICSRINFQIVSTNFIINSEFILSLNSYSLVNNVISVVTSALNILKRRLYLLSMYFSYLYIRYPCENNETKSLSTKKEAIVYVD